MKRNKERTPVFVSLSFTRDECVSNGNSIDKKYSTRKIQRYRLTKIENEIPAEKLAGKRRRRTATWRAEDRDNGRSEFIRFFATDKLLAIESRIEQRRGAIRQQLRLKDLDRMVEQRGREKKIQRGGCVSRWNIR